MKQSRLIPLVTLSLLAGAALTGCGGRTPGSVIPDTPASTAPTTGVTNPSYTAPTTTTPYPDTYTQPVANTPVTAAPTVSMPMTPSGTFKVHQGNLIYGWRARGIAVSGGSIYIAAVDNDGLTKNGTVLKMDAMTGKNWKDLATGFLGLTSKLSSNLQGVAVAGGNLFAIDGTLGMFSISTSGGQVKELKGGGGTDLAGSNYGVFVASHSTLERGDMTGMSRTPMPQIVTSGGIGSDTRGNIFFINGPRVGVLSTNGVPQDVILSGLAQPIDVAADGRTGEILVLDGPDVKRFNNGQMIGSFQHGATQATSIAVDETGNIYVADYGSSSSDSKIIKFAPANAGQPMNGGVAAYPQTGYQTGYPQTAYPQTGYQTGYPQTAYPQTGYQTGYPQTAYPQTSYGAYAAPSTGYAQPQQAYPQTAYPQAATQQPVYGAYSQPQQARQY